MKQDIRVCDHLVISLTHLLQSSVYTVYSDQSHTPPAVQPIHCAQSTVSHTSCSPAYTLYTVISLTHLLQSSLYTVYSHQSHTPPAVQPIHCTQWCAESYGIMYKVHLGVHYPPLWPALQSVHNEVRPTSNKVDFMRIVSVTLHPLGTTRLNHGLI